MFFVEISIDDLPFRMFVPRQLGNGFDLLGNLYKRVNQ